MVRSNHRSAHSFIPHTFRAPSQLLVRKRPEVFLTKWFSTYFLIIFRDFDKCFLAKIFNTITNLQLLLLHKRICLFVQHNWLSKNRPESLQIISVLKINHFIMISKSLIVNLCSDLNEWVSLPQDLSILSLTFLRNCIHWIFWTFIQKLFLQKLSQVRSGQVKLGNTKMLVIYWIKWSHYPL